MCHRIGIHRSCGPGRSAFCCWIVLASLLCALPCVIAAAASSEQMEWIRVSDEQDGFVFAESDRDFTPWGFNYDHDEQGRLLEDYWASQWPKVEEDFREMKQLGANVVRVHLQLGKFLDGPQTANRASLDRLTRLVKLAERLRLYLDLTGLGCYHKQDVPAWYDRLAEKERWRVQARFWEAIAARCATSPAVFCYDLMNEPVAPAADRRPGEWLGPDFAGKHFVQFVSLTPAGRPRPAIARRWIQGLSAAIRKHDRRHLITVGLVPWSLDRPGLTSGFVPEEIVDKLDFISVHLYPKTSGIKEAMKTLDGFSVGKPVVIEETFPLKCSLPELEQFIQESRGTACGWIGFYWGKTPEECRRSNRIQDALMLGWLELFAKQAKAVVK